MLLERLVRLGPKRGLLLALSILGALLILNQLGSLHASRDDDDDFRIQPTSALHHHLQPIENSGKRQSLREQAASVRTVDNAPHSRTLGIAEAIFVLSLTRVKDRREMMESLADALDLEFTYIDATDYKTVKGDALARQLIDRVRWQRSRIDEREVDESKGEIPKPDESGSKSYVLNAFPFEWSHDSVSNAHNPLDQPLGLSGADYWEMEPPDEDWEARHPLPVLDKNWLGSKEGRVSLASRTNAVHRADHLTKPGLAAYHTHVRAVREIVKQNLTAAIILEDDVDIEWDIERTLRMQWSALPPTWDIVYLGHCWSTTEHTSPSLPQAPMFRHTSHVLCNHAYVVSLRGAHKILRYFRSPDFAYSRPVDQAYKDLIQLKLLESFSVVPAQVIQTKRTASEISVGSQNTGWKDVSGEALLDSTLERVEMARKLFAEPSMHDERSDQRHGAARIMKEY